MIFILVCKCMNCLHNMTWQNLSIWQVQDLYLEYKYLLDIFRFGVVFEKNIFYSKVLSEQFFWVWNRHICMDRKHQKYYQNGAALKDLKMSLHEKSRYVDSALIARPVVVAQLVEHLFLETRDLEIESNPWKYLFQLYWKTICGESLPQTTK